MYDILNVDVVNISNGCYRLPTFNSETVQYNITVIEHFPTKHDLTDVNHSLPANTDFSSLAAFRRTVFSIDLAKFLYCNNV